MEFLEWKHEDVLKQLPERKPWSHKGDYGRILLLCGSRGLTGAAALACRGALRTGAGLVYLGVPESIYAIEAMKLEEPVVFPLPEDEGKLSADSIPELLKRMENMDAILIGPGLGQSDGTLAVLDTVMKRFPGPVVVDADGINLLAGHKNMLRDRTGITIVTPHDGEFRRFGWELSERRWEVAGNFAREYGCILLLKGHRTVVTDGIRYFQNPTGNPGMAVGGSGDVLAGMITSLLGQKIPPLEAAACGAWLHGAAGDICARQLGQYGMLPSDMVEVLPRLLK